MLRTDDSIASIGESVGYPEIHSFTRTFKAYYGVAPGQFRQAQQQPREPPPQSPVSAANQSVEIIERPATRLFGLDHYGDYLAIGATFEKAMAICTVEGIPAEFPHTMGVYFNDPESIDNRQLRSFAGLVVTDNAVLPDSLQQYTLPGGHFAVMTHTGPYARLEQSYLWLFSRWLPESGLAVRDLPCCEMYLNSPLTTEPDDLRTAICLPVQ